MLRKDCHETFSAHNALYYEKDKMMKIFYHKQLFEFMPVVWEKIAQHGKLVQFVDIPILYIENWADSNELGDKNVPEPLLNESWSNNLIILMYNA